MQRSMRSEQSSEQKRDSPLKGTGFERMKFKGEDMQLVFEGENIQHIMWKDEESDSETSSTHSASSSISDSEEDVPYVKKPSQSELDGLSQQSKEIVAEKRSHPSFQWYLHQSRQTVGEQSDRHFVKHEGVSMSSVKGFPMHYRTDQIFQNSRRMLSAGSVVSDESPSRTGLPSYSPGLVPDLCAQGLVHYPCDQRFWTKNTRSMESLSTVASFEDLARLPFASMESLMPAALDQGYLGAKRSGKLQPCKGKRDGYQKSVSFDLESTELPSSLATDDNALGI